MRLSKIVCCLLIGCFSLTPNFGAIANEMALPSLGDASSRIVSPELERQIGEAFLKQMHATMRTSSDPLVKYFVATQISNLAQFSDLKEALLTTIVVDDPNINAFAAPGGVVGVNLGLFLYAEDIHEYASVMAHELAHLSQRHFARGIEEQQAQSLPLLASMLASIIVAVVGGGDAGLAAISTTQAAAHANQMRFSREREQEADRVGLNTLVRANHDPAAMARMFERMQRAYRFTRKPPEFLLTHPLSETRIADARNQAIRLPRGEYVDSLDYQLMRTRIEVYFQTNHKQGIEKYRQQLRANPNDTAAQYGLALSLNAEGDHQAAVDMGERLIAINPQSILYNAIYADLLIDAGFHRQAQTLLKQQLKINPDNTPLTMLYAKVLIKAHEYTEAENVLERQAKVNPMDIDVWYELAETAGLAGNITGVHLARAEYFYLHGAYHRSIQHLEYAQRLVRRTNPQLVAKLGQRIQDLRTEIRMQQG